MTEASVTALLVKPTDGYLEDEWTERHVASLEGNLPWKTVRSPFLPEVDTEFCLVAPNSGWWDEYASVKGLLQYAWDGTDVVYANVVYKQNDVWTGALVAQEFCAERTMVEDWVPPAFLIRTRLLAQHDDLWGLFRSIARTARFKASPHSTFVDVGYPPAHRIDPEAGRDLKATFYCQATPATTYLRCLLPSRVLPAQTSPEMVWTETDTDYEFPLHRGKTAVMQFAGDKTWALGLLGMRNKGIRVLIETDDNYRFAVKEIMRNSGWQARIGEGRHTFEGHAYCVREADGMIVTNEALARTYRKLNPNVWVCPNQVDPSDWMERERPDRPFTIGWFASRSHMADAKLVERAFDWASRQPGVVVKTMGMDPVWGKFPREHINWVTDLAVYRRAMLDLDVGLAPVVPTAWSICRSDVKALEYAMGGAALVLSDEEPYSYWRDKPALMCKTAKDFFHAVKWAVANQDECRAMAREARELVLKERTIQANAWRWEEALDG